MTQTDEEIKKLSYEFRDKLRLGDDLDIMVFNLYKANQILLIKIIIDMIDSIEVDRCYYCNDSIRDSILLKLKDLIKYI
jgi:hypothetical protein